MSINRISIIRSLGKVFSKTKKILGIQGENMKDVLLFALDEKIEGNAIVEVELPNGTRSFIELTEVEDGYELPVKSVLTEQVGFVKFQLRILQNKVEVFKSEIFELEVKESLNAVYEEPDEYPTWLDKLEDLQSELNEAENERVSNEEERVNAEEKRKKDFEQIQESAKNIKDLTDDYNSNATEKTKEFNENYTQKLETFNDNCLKATTNFNNNAKLKYDDYNKNADDKVSNYNNNHDEKIKIYNDNHTSKITEFNNNAKAKIDNYNSNASKKLEEYNSNDKTKTEAYNTNASTKLNNYNSNVTTKENEYNSNAENKTNEFNNNASEKLEEYNQNAESLINRVVECEAENERLREDIKSIATIGEASGENIHLEDSSDARCEIEICGNHSQDTRSGKNKLLNDAEGAVINGVTFTKNTDGSVVANGTATDGINYYLSEISTTIEAGIYKLSDGVNDESSTTYFTHVDCKNEDGSVYDTGNLSTAGVSSRVYSESKLIRGRIVVRKGVTLSNVVFKPQLELVKSVNDVATDYEQYGASPSIDYPSPVKSVGNIKNILDMSNAKNGASAGIICTTNADGSYKYKGTATSQYVNVWFMGGYATDLPTLFTLEPGTYYINDVSLFEGTTGFANDSSKKIWTFTRAYNVTGVRAPNAVSGNTYNETKYPIIAKIDHEIPWIPYDCGYAKVDIFNKNYLSKIPKKSITAQGITSTFDGEKFICKGTAQTNYFNLFTEKVYKKIGKGIKTLSTNKLKKGRVFIHFDYVDGTGQNYYTSINTNQFKFTLNKDVESYRLNVDSITAGDTIDDNIYVQLEDGNIATEIVKAKNQEFVVDVQQPMFEGDKFIKTDGKWYEKHNWITLLNENIINNIDGIKDKSKKTITTSIKLTETPAERSAISNILTYTNNWNDTEHMIFSASLNTIYCLYNKDRFSELNYETIKKEIGEFSGIIKYKSNKSTYLECTEAQNKVLDEIYNKAHTYKNITNISAESSEVNPIVSLKYLKDVETEHNKLQAQINEIKELLSSTETSSLLLDNIQKDLESEV